MSFLSGSILVHMLLGPTDLFGLSEDIFCISSLLVGLTKKEFSGLR